MARVALSRYRLLSCALAAPARGFAARPGGLLGFLCGSCVMQLAALSGGFCVVQLAVRLGRYWAGEGDDGVVGPARKAGLKAGWPQTGRPETGRPEASPNRLVHKPADSKPAQTGRHKPAGPKPADSKPANLLVVFATVGKQSIALAIRHQMSDNRHNGGLQTCRAHTCHRRRERKSKGANSCLT